MTPETIAMLAALYFLGKKGPPAAPPAPAAPPKPRVPQALPAKPAPTRPVAPGMRRPVTAAVRRPVTAAVRRPGGKPVYSADAVAARIRALPARANQARAKAWVPHLVRAGAPQSLAEGLARWIGIESSGNPLKPSRLGERGLLQIMPTTAVRVFTPDEIARLAAPATTNEEHARLAIKQFRWHMARAKVTETAPITDQLFYAKAHHTRPADLAASPARPPASIAVKFLAAKAKAPLQRLRLASASTVAFGSPGVA